MINLVELDQRKRERERERERERGGGQAKNGDRLQSAEERKKTKLDSIHDLTDIPESH